MVECMGGWVHAAGAGGACACGCAEVGVQDRTHVLVTVRVLTDSDPHNPHIKPRATTGRKRA